MKKIISVLMISVGLSALVGCSNPTSPYKEDLKVAKEAIEEKVLEKEVVSLRSKVVALSQEKVYADYLKNEKVLEKIDSLLAYHPKLVEAYDELMILKEEPVNAENKRLAGIRDKKMNSVLLSSRKEGRDILDEAKFVAEFYRSLAAYVKRADKYLEDAQKSFDVFVEKADSSIQKHPHKKKQINLMVDSLKGDLDKLSQLKKDLDRLQGDGKTVDDYGLLKVRIDRHLTRNVVTNGVSIQTKRLGELDVTYVKILKDIEESYSVQLGGASWYEYYDWPTETTVVFPETSITEQQYNNLVSNPIKGTYSIRDWKENSLVHNLTSGKIDNAFPSGDNRAELWIEDLTAEYFYKYEIVTDQGVSETDWVAVSKNEYLAHKNHVGMEILSKPYGYFEDEASTIPSPAGASLVGNPEYGQWRTDPNTGASIWEWLMVWSVMDSLSNSRYDRGYYDSYSERRSRELSSMYSPSKGGYTPQYKRSISEINARRNGKGFVKPSNMKSLSSVSGRSLKSRASSVRGRGPAGGGK